MATTSEMKFRAVLIVSIITHKILNDNNQILKNARQSHNRNRKAKRR